MRRSPLRPSSPKVVDREGEAIDLGTVECLKHCQCEILIGGGEVEICGEPAGVARAELSERSPALEDEVILEQSRLV
jgi:hypothetical protein